MPHPLTPLGPLLARHSQPFLLPSLPLPAYTCSPVTLTCSYLHSPSSLSPLCPVCLPFLSTSILLPDPLVVLLYFLLLFLPFPPLSALSAYLLFLPPSSYLVLLFFCFTLCSCFHLLSLLTPMHFHLLLLFSLLSPLRLYPFSVLLYLYSALYLLAH